MTDNPMARMKRDFIADASDTVEKISHSLAALGSDQSPSRSQVDWLFRTVHSLKGTSGMFELHEVSGLAGSVEDLLELVRSGGLGVDAQVLDLLVEAFDELSILLRMAGGEEARSDWSGTRSKLDRLVETVSGISGTAGCGTRPRPLPELRSDLNLVLSSEELAATRRHLERGARVCRLSLEIEAARASEQEQAVLKHLQQSGEIISVLPPGNKVATPGKKVLSLIYAPYEGEADIVGLEDGVGATVEYIGAGETCQASGSSGRSVSSGSTSANSGSSSETGTSLSVKVDIGVLDVMMNMVSELYSVRLGLLGVARRLPHTDETRRLRDDLLKIGLTLKNRVSSLENNIAEVRLVPVSLLFERYRAEVRRLARHSGKKVTLEFEGGATRVDRAMLDNLHDPLLHIIRNAVDHGIEPPHERLEIGKPEGGRILLSARQEASHICIEVSDDGRGIDGMHVRRKAIEKGLPHARTASPLTLIFEPGMSTSGDVSDISGRGVGLDAAKDRIDSLKGVIGVQSVPQEGTSFSVYVPLTLAITRGMLVEENGLPAVIPLRTVIEVSALGKETALELRRTGTIMHEGHSLRGLILSDLLGVVSRRDARSAVILGVGKKRRALLAQKVAGETDVVSRPLPKAMDAPAFVAGATELHDGRPAIIVQPEDLLRENTGEDRAQSRGASEFLEREPMMDWMKGKSIQMLIFKSGGGMYGIALDLLREVVSLRSFIEVPALGTMWRGIFFNRGMCHGLLKLFDSQTSVNDVSSIAILTYPERCGIGMDEVIGNFEIPGSEIELCSGGGVSGLLRPCGRLAWEGKEVIVVGMRTGVSCSNTDELDPVGQKG